MKNLLLKTLLFSGILLNAQVGNADAWTHYGGACNWFSNRYKAHVGIKRNGEAGCFCCHTDANCSGVELNCEYTTVTIPPEVPFRYYVAQAYAKINATENRVIEYGGFADGRDWYAGADVTYKVPLYSRSPMIERMAGVDKKKVGSWASVGKIVFDTDNHLIHLYNITGSIEVDSYDKANDFGAIALSVTREPITSKVSDYEPSDEEYVRRLVWETKSMLNNGRISTVGDLSPKRFSHKISGNKLVADLKVDHLVISIDPAIDMSTLLVNVGVDNGNIGMGVSDKFKVESAAASQQLTEPVESAELLEFVNYPNPVVGKTTKVYFKLPQSQHVQLSLCNEQGVPVTLLYDGEAVANQRKEFDVDLQILRNHVGFLKLTLPDKVLVRKILVTH